MKGLFCCLLVVILALVGVLPASIAAQHNDWICDGGSNDIVKAANNMVDEANDLSGDARTEKLLEAFWLAAQGEVLCVADVDRFGEAQSLIRRLEPRLRKIPGGPLGLEPGIVELGAFGLNMICSGEGSPTVVFETGFGGGAIGTWAAVHSAISTYTRACRYDRRNLGGSARSARLENGVVRTTQDQIDDLILLLATAEIEPPYVLVAHSQGGMNSLLFTEQYPELVGGLVMVDAAHPTGASRLCEVDPDRCLLNLPLDTSVNPELLDFAASEEQVRGLDSVGEYPLVVLTAMQRISFLSDAQYEVWFELQAALATLSTNSRHVALENSSHNFSTGADLNLVIDGIIWVIDEVRAAEE